MGGVSGSRIARRVYVTPQAVDGVSVRVGDDDVEVVSRTSDVSK
jgi:hypothetical protein